MTKAELRTKVKAYIAQQGTAFVDSDAEIDAEIFESIKQVVSLTKCLFSDQIVFTPTAGAREHEFGTASAMFTVGGVNVSLVEILGVHQRIDGKLQPILDLWGKSGPTSLASLVASYPDYLDSSMNPATNVRHFVILPPSTLYLFPAVVASPGLWQIAGFYQHPAFASDNAECLIPDDFQRDLVRFAASELMEPTATGESQEAIWKYLERARGAFKALGDQASSQLRSGTRRGHRPIGGIHRLS